MKDCQQWHTASQTILQGLSHKCPRSRLQAQKEHSLPCSSGHCNNNFFSVTPLRYHLLDFAFALAVTCATLTASRLFLDFFVFLCSHALSWSRTVTSIRQCTKFESFCRFLPSWKKHPYHAFIQSFSRSGSPSSACKSVFSHLIGIYFFYMSSNNAAKR